MSKSLKIIRTFQPFHFLNSLRVMHRSNANDEVLLDEFLVSETSPLVGKSLAEAALTKTHDVIILAIKSQETPILQKTRADTVVQAGDVLLVAGSKTHLQGLNEMM